MEKAEPASGESLPLRIPAELIADLGHFLFRSGVVATDEHRWAATGEVGIHHERVADGIERLDEARGGHVALKLFHQRIVAAHEVRQDAVDRRLVIDGVRGVDDDLARQVRVTCQIQRRDTGATEYGDDDDVGKLRGLGKVTERDAGAFFRLLRL